VGQGLRRTRGEYFAFQDSDHRWAPNKLERSMDAFADARLETGAVYCDRDGRVTYHRSPRPVSLPDQTSPQNLIPRNGWPTYSRISTTPWRQ
jgi:glycosyltransferase involved in cell wall biosynthesis